MIGSKKIDKFYVFDDELGVNMMFVTKDDDRVYGLGANVWGLLGLGHNQWVSEPQEIIELSNKICIKFINGSEFIVCLTRDNCVYSCGLDRNGQLGRGCDDNNYKKPMIIQINDNNDLIRDMSCGSYHTLVLTHNNDMYGLGSQSFRTNRDRDKYISSEWSDKYNKLFDITIGATKTLYAKRPTCAQIIEQYNEWAIDSTVVTNDVEFNEKLQQIKHKEWKLLLTNNNEVYGWGRNHFGQIGSRDTTCEAITKPEKQLMF
ncbi:RCC1 and BTB domain-containing protein 2-like [Oppia nitens]|uniref:RCC1 and BTB domain-containing protein 2-like n=1 Tax=Oppia nitens TaxID=1686743 RepID=UPI0023D9D917|nr:RCC1 and BTB domain-containing protein 2-like [Oppia nitens]